MDEIWVGSEYAVGRNTGFVSQTSIAVARGIMVSSSAGHVNHEKCDSNNGKKKEKISVRTAAPMNPSHVLFGESEMKGALINFRPIVMPQKYAETSFITTVAIGKKNQNSPFSTSDAKNLHCPTTINTVAIVHINWLSWKRIRPGLNVSTAI